jgi:hypothetical protein
MTTPDHDESKPRRRWPTYLAIVLALVLILYPLSSGPAMVLMIRFFHPAVYRAFHVAYTPLAKATDYTGTSSILHSYIDCWIEITNTPRE